MYTQDRCAVNLSDIQPDSPAPITVTVTVPNQDHCTATAPARSTRRPMSGWERTIAISALIGTIATVVLPAGIWIGLNLSATEINRATGAKAKAEAALNANRTQIENFCKNVK